MAIPDELHSPIQLLVEGRDDLNFVESLMPNTSKIQIWDFEGVRKLRLILPALMSNRSFKSVKAIGIIRDADKSEQSAFQNVANELRRVGLSVPTTQGVAIPGVPAVGVLILPGNGRSGELETLICDSFAGTPEDRCIDNFFACFKSSSGNDVPKKYKARANAYLSLTNDPLVSVGIAAKQSKWNLTHSAFDPIRGFLANLLSQSP